MMYGDMLSQLAENLSSEEISEQNKVIKKQSFNLVEVINLMRELTDQVDSLYRPYTRNNTLGWENLNSFLESKGL